MQFQIDMVLLSVLVTVILSSILSAYLFRVWYRQSARLYTDLPLVFGISFLAQSINMFILTLVNLGFAEMTLTLFRIRAIVISGACIPVLGALLQIWAPRIQKHHLRIEFLFAASWFAITFLSPNEVMAMSVLIPMLLAVGVGMLVTFTVTWKTGRLKEVRSDLMVIAGLFGLVSQVLRVPLMATQYFFIPDVFLAVSSIGTVLALTNPWYRPDDFARVSPIEVEPRIGTY
ncbi:MAG: hypothetical protein AM324_006145 [Candidatus Thorarchaeota archaeon SMTZ1-83]|nr:MAG: hypothetical protein AM324_07280 [Candidatus Thorarchaeota archaeon SMTZ1-83]